jgi:hypothetical protein
MTEGEEEAALGEIVQRVSQSDVAAFGVTDYWTFDGYWALRDHLATTGRTLEKAVFPGTELRIEAPVDYRLNIDANIQPVLYLQQVRSPRIR